VSLVACFWVCPGMAKLNENLRAVLAHLKAKGLSVKDVAERAFFFGVEERDAYYKWLRRVKTEENSRPNARYERALLCLLYSDGRGLLSDEAFDHAKALERYDLVNEVITFGKVPEKKHRKESEPKPTAPAPDDNSDINNALLTHMRDRFIGSRHEGGNPRDAALRYLLQGRAADPVVPKLFDPQSRSYLIQVRSRIKAKMGPEVNLEQAIDLVLDELRHSFGPPQK
jgi:hypothetical protein